jgi:hypothetical protein
MKRTRPTPSEHVLAYPIVRPVPRPRPSAIDQPGIW